MIKYKTSFLFDEIETIEIEGETKTQVILPSKNGKPSRRERKKSSFVNYHDSWDEAHKYLLEHAEKEIENLRKETEKAQEKIEKIRRMSPF